MCLQLALRETTASHDSTTLYCKTMWNCHRVCNGKLAPAKPDTARRFNLLFWLSPCMCQHHETLNCSSSTTRSTRVRNKQTRDHNRIEKNKTSALSTMCRDRSNIAEAYSSDPPLVTQRAHARGQIRGIALRQGAKPSGNAGERGPRREYRNHKHLSTTSLDNFPLRRSLRMSAGRARLHLNYKSLIVVVETGC